MTSRLPLPVTVLALGWVILGNILTNIIPVLSDICIVVSIILLIMTVIKIVLNLKEFYRSIKSPAGLSMFSSFSMSLMLIAVWMKGVLDKANIYIWIVGVVLQTIIMIVFTIKYVLNFKLKYVFSSWFLVYSGIGIASITCNDFGMIVFGRSVLKFTIIVSAILVPFVLARMKIKGSTQAARPIFSLIAVPLGIIIPAVVVISEPFSAKTMWIMYILIQILMLIIVIDMLIRLFHGFYPSWSCYAVAMTFSVYGSKFFNTYLISNRMQNYIVESLLYFECVLAFLVCAIVLLAYFINTLEDPEIHKKKVHEKVLVEKAAREKRRARYKSRKKEENSGKNTVRELDDTSTLFENDDISDLLD